MERSPAPPCTSTPGSGAVRPGKQGLWCAGHAAAPLSDAGDTGHVRQVLCALGLAYRPSRLWQLTVTRDGSQTHFSRLRQAIVAPDNDDWSELFTEQLGPRLSRGHQAGLLATLSCSDTPWPICEMVLQQIGRKPTANKRLAALTVTLLQRVRDRGSASQRHLLLQGLRRHSGGDDWPTWMLQMHTSPQKFSMGSMQTECLGVTWADAVWTQTNEGAISEGGRALADSLRPVEGEAN